MKQREKRAKRVSPNKFDVIARGFSSWNTRVTATLSGIPRGPKSAGARVQNEGCRRQFTVDRTAFRMQAALAACRAIKGSWQVKPVLNEHVSVAQYYHRRARSL